MTGSNGMCDEVQSLLKSSIGTGEVIGVVYHGGSQPGSYREIVPLQISDGKVRARCLTSQAVKVFVLSKLSIAPPRSAEDAPKHAWRPKTQANPLINISIALVYEVYLPALDAAGWHVECEHNEDGSFLKLFARLKNGKLRKHPDCELSYQSMIYAPVTLEDGSSIGDELRSRSRPWGVSGKSKSRTWADPNRALLAFLEIAGVEPI